MGLKPFKSKSSASASSSSSSPSRPKVHDDYTNFKRVLKEDAPVHEQEEEELEEEATPTRERHVLNKAGAAEPLSNGVSLSGNKAAFVSLTSFRTARTEVTASATTGGGGGGGSTAGLDDTSTEEDDDDGEEESEGHLTPTKLSARELSTGPVALAPPSTVASAGAPNRSLLSYLPSVSLPSVSLPSISLPSFSFPSPPSSHSFSFLPKLGIPTFSLLSSSNADGPSPSTGTGPGSGNGSGNDLHAVELRRQGSGKGRIDKERGETTEFVRALLGGEGPTGDEGKVSMDLRMEEATANGRTFPDVSSPLSAESPGFENGVPSTSDLGGKETTGLHSHSGSVGEGTTIRRKAASEVGVISLGGGEERATKRDARISVSETGVLQSSLGQSLSQWKGKGKAVEGESGGTRSRAASASASVGTKSRKGLFGMFRKNREGNNVPPPLPGGGGGGGTHTKGAEEILSSTSSPAGSRPNSMNLGRRSGNEGGGGGDDAEFETLLSSDPPTTPVMLPEKKEKVQFVKVKAKNKSIKSFDKLFLAQQLFIPFPKPTLPTSNSNPSSTSPLPPSATTETGSIHSSGRGENASLHSTNTPAPSAAPALDGALPDLKKKAVWCCKWSNDGRYLATGGRDCLVRVWEVLSTPDARRAAMFPDPVDSSGCPVRVDSSVNSGSRTTSSSGKKAPPLRTPVATMPVFHSKPVYEFQGHTADVLAICWSKNDFLLSSSMDKTVRLWHISRPECLCAFLHLDFVTSIAFHPKDDRFFLSGSLDCKLRLWNIPEKRVHVWTELPEFVTSVAFTSDGKLAIAGIFSGHCMFFEVGTFRYHSQFAAKSSRGKNAKGSKVASMMALPLASAEGERLLVSSNDSRIRLYGVTQKNVEAKYKGLVNESSQITASFSDDGRWVISGSEDGQVYLWESGLYPNDRGGWSMRNKEDGSAFETFHASSSVAICANFAPRPTRNILASSLDPIFSTSEYLELPHLAPSNPSLTVYPSNRTSSARASPSSTRNSFIGSMSTSTSTSATFSGSKDAIIVVADDSGIISVYRNSILPVPGAKEEE